LQHSFIGDIDIAYHCVDWVTFWFLTVCQLCYSDYVSVNHYSCLCIVDNHITVSIVAIKVSKIDIMLSLW